MNTSPPPPLSAVVTGTLPLGDVYGRLDRATRAELRRAWTTVRPLTPGTLRPQSADELRAALRAVVRRRYLDELSARSLAVTLPTERTEMRDSLDRLVFLAEAALHLGISGYLTPDVGDRLRLRQAWLCSDLASLDPGLHPGLPDLMEFATEVHLASERDATYHRKALLRARQSGRLERRLAEEEDALHHLDAGREESALLHPHWT